MTTNDEVFPKGKELPVDPPAWLIVLDLGDDCLREYQRFPRNQEQYEQARFDYAEACFEAQRDYEGGWSPGDPDFYDGPIDEWNPDESVLLELALLLLGSQEKGATETIEEAVAWLRTELEGPVPAGLDPDNPEDADFLAMRDQQCSELLDAIEAHRTELMALLE